MIFPPTGSDQLPFATVRIEGVHANGGTSVGTAFFFQFTKPLGEKVPYLVTNRHVVADCRHGRLLVHTAICNLEGQKTGTGPSLVVELADFSNDWICHPNPEVDLCVMPIEPLRAKAQEAGAALYSIALDESLIRSDEELGEFYAITNVYMVGYPIGLWDGTNNLPLIRRGITALHPQIDFNGKAVGCVDIAALPGSSGSPILVFDEGTFPTRQGPVAGTRAVLLGILFSGPQLRVDGTVSIEQVPTAARAVSVSLIPAHLGYYIKAKELLGFSKVLWPESTEPKNSSPP
jgi:hypothetical protein